MSRIVDVSELHEFGMSSPRPVSRNRVSCLAFVAAGTHGLPAALNSQLQ